MNADLEKSLSNSGRLSSVQGESSLSGSPCRGVCSTTYGDLRCRTCGRHQKEITEWQTYDNFKKKIINLRNAGEGYKIRQLESQEERWRDLQKLKNIDDLTVRDAIKRVVQVAGVQGEMYPHDHRCIDILTKIIVSNHKFNDISIKSLMSENDFAEVKKKYE